MMDGEERNASLPILGWDETFPRTDPTGPRNPLSSQVAPRVLYTAARPHRGAVDRSEKGKGGPGEKNEQKIAGNSGNPSG